MYKAARLIKNDYRRFQDFVKLGLQGPQLIALLNRAVKEHHFVENMFAERIQQGRCGSQVVFPYMNLPRNRYFERNFFSILFLSVFLSLNIPLYRRLRYGLILHCLRTIVTNADNILDKEHKGAVRLEVKEANTVLKNYLVTLMSQRIMSQAIRQVVDSDAEAAYIETRLVDSLYSIAAGESITSMQGKDEIPQPETLIETVHEKIGGELLRLSLVGPIENEKLLSEPLHLAEKGILAIGVALQMLDDVVDIEEDIRDNKTNLLASWVVHNNKNGSLTWAQLRQRQASGQFNIDAYAAMRTQIINAAIQKALEGFEWLSRSGYPIKRKQAISVLKIMFRLRGLEKEWNNSEYKKHV